VTNQTPDLFGQTPPQGDLFAGERRSDHRVVIDPDNIRRRLHKMLAEARAADSRPPWSDGTTRSNVFVFPQMANWLPVEEAEQLRLEFRAEMVRLKALPAN